MSYEWHVEKHNYTMSITHSWYCNVCVYSIKQLPYAYWHTWMHMHMHRLTDTHMHTPMATAYTTTRTHAHTTHTHNNTNRCTWPCTCMMKFIHTHVSIRTYVCTNTHIHTHTHIILMLLTVVKWDLLVLPSKYQLVSSLLMLINTVKLYLSFYCAIFNEIGSHWL